MCKEKENKGNRKEDPIKACGGRWGNRTVWHHTKDGGGEASEHHQFQCNTNTKERSKKTEGKATRYVRSSFLETFQRANYQQN